MVADDHELTVVVDSAGTLHLDCSCNAWSWKSEHVATTLDELMVQRDNHHHTMKEKEDNQ